MVVRLAVWPVARGVASVVLRRAPGLSGAVVIFGLIDRIFNDSGGVQIVSGTVSGCG